MTLTVWYKDNPDSIYENVFGVATPGENYVAVRFRDDDGTPRCKMVHLDADTRVELMAD